MNSQNTSGRDNPADRVEVSLKDVTPDERKTLLSRLMGRFQRGAAMPLGEKPGDDHEVKPAEPSSTYEEMGVARDHVTHEQVSDYVPAELFIMDDDQTQVDPSVLSSYSHNAVLKVGERRRRIKRRAAQAILAIENTIRLLEEVKGFERETSDGPGKVTNDTIEVLQGRKRAILEYMTRRYNVTQKALRAYR